MSTKVNPANHLTRGVKLVELVKMDSWWRGPSFLLDDQESWPKAVINQNIESATEEVKRGIVVS